MLLGLAVPAAGLAQSVPRVTADELEDLIAQHSGSVVIVNFWATWCPPCLREFPDIVEFYTDRHGDGVEVIAVSMNSDEETDEVAEFLADFAPPFAVYRAATQDEAFYRGVLDSWYGEMPTTLIFDTAGQRARIHKKPLSYAELETDVDRLLAAAAE